MILFIAGMLTGAVAGIFAIALVKAADTRADENLAPSELERRLNAEKQEHERFMKEQQRQFDMLLKYTGERQK